jgi:hypothetical protein
MEEKTNDGKERRERDHERGARIHHVHTIAYMTTAAIGAKTKKPTLSSAEEVEKAIAHPRRRTRSPAKQP